MGVRVTSLGTTRLSTSAGGPEKDAGDVESGQVDGRGLLVARGDGAPLLQAVAAPFDGVALFVGLAVERRRSPAPAAPPQPVATLVCRYGITARMRRLLRWLRIAGEEYA